MGAVEGGALPDARPAGRGGARFFSCQCLLRRAATDLHREKKKRLRTHLAAGLLGVKVGLLHLQREALELLQRSGVLAHKQRVDELGEV